jgi:hypothetical protein
MSTKEFVLIAVIIVISALIITDSVTYQKFRIFQITNGQGDCNGIIKICGNTICVNETLLSENVQTTCGVNKASK